mmetsp:Transcript_15775/g.60043  ORF Transcript_15775/g.60043 Transcript_15775/m.60043 type:complete len:268 (-) Transcript_15775:591-1394(-)
MDSAGWERAAKAENSAKSWSFGAEVRRTLRFHALGTAFSSLFGALPMQISRRGRDSDGGLRLRGQFCDDRGGRLHRQPGAVAHLGLQHVGSGWSGQLALGCGRGGPGQRHRGPGAAVWPSVAVADCAAIGAAYREILQDRGHGPWRLDWLHLRDDAASVHGERLRRHRSQPPEQGGARAVQRMLPRLHRGAGAVRKAPAHRDLARGQAGRRHCSQRILPVQRHHAAQRRGSGVPSRRRGGGRGFPASEAGLHVHPKVSEWFQCDWGV